MRTAPDEVSFAREDAWSDIFLSRPGHKPFLKDPVLFKSPPGQVPNLFTVIDVHENARMRQLLMPAFTDRALLKQESTIQFYVAILISRLKELVDTPENASEGPVINIVDWMNWMAFDIIGDLSFGESFGCLRDTKSHPWVSLLFGAFKSKNGYPHLVVMLVLRYPILIVISISTTNCYSILPWSGIIPDELRSCQRDKKAARPLCFRPREDPQPSESRDPA